MKLSFVIEEGDMRTAAGRHFNYRYPFFRYSGPILGGLLLVMSVFFLMNIGEGPNAFLGIICLAAGLRSLFRKKFYVWRTAKGLFKGKEGEDFTQWIEADEEGLAMRHRKSEGRIDWDGFVDVQECPEGLLLYPQKNLFVWIPCSATMSEGRWEDFVSLVTSKITKKL
ncbi:MAG: YcxB family protein [Verrucomicrobiota bacterium JB023]|nr:YcxB family protein [Verrucomicrobiota bacterium JB023]